MQPHLLGIPALGAMGFIAAIILVIWILMSIFKKPK